MRSCPAAAPGLLSCVSGVLLGCWLVSVGFRSLTTTWCDLCLGLTGDLAGLKVGSSVGQRWCLVVGGFVVLWGFELCF